MSDRNRREQRAKQSEIAAAIAVGLLLARVEIDLPASEVVPKELATLIESIQQVTGGDKTASVKIEALMKTLAGVQLQPGEKYPEAIVRTVRQHSERLKCEQRLRTLYQRRDTLTDADFLEQMRQVTK